MNSANEHERNPEGAAAAFLDAKAKIDRALLALTAESANHFSTETAAIGWSDVASLNHVVTELEPILEFLNLLPPALPGAGR